jgi:hypothetical protein
MRAFRPLLVTSLIVTLTGCGSDRLTAPDRSSNATVDSRSDTFLLTSPMDGRLPVPGSEPATATTEDLAPLRDLSASAENLQPAATNPVLVWNALAEELGLAAKQPPPLFARSYALVQVGIYDALLASRAPLRGRLPERTVTAGAASRVLAYLFPGSLERIQAVTAEQLALDGGTRSLAAWLLGRAVGTLVVTRAQRDGSDTPFSGRIPTGDGIWTGSNPVLPMCGTWKTWILTSGSAVEPPAPYRYGSAEDLADVQEVLDISLTRTPEQIAAVHKWGDVSPPVIWNRLLNARAEAQGLGTLEAARAHAYLNVAMTDAFICCWATKYTYWTARPFHRIPGLTTVIPTPNFPSYTSGHSTISAAAAEVMGALFPGEADHFRAEAAEAAMSRLWGGIHFRQDNERGAEVGTWIGELVVARMMGRSELMLARAE